MGRKGANRTAKQKAADRKRSAEMKGKGFGSTRRRRRSSSSSRSSGSSHRQRKGWTVARGAKVLAIGVGLVKGGSDLVEGYSAARSAGWNKFDALAYSVMGVRALSQQLAGKDLGPVMGGKIDTGQTGGILVDALLVFGAPKAIDRLAAKIDPDVRKLNVPLTKITVA